MPETLLDFVDRLAIIHLPDRTDRYAEMEAELAYLGIDIRGAKVQIPFAPKPADPNGFTSRGVYGSYLSHMQIIEAARDEGLESVWILEDDAIFSRTFAKSQPDVGGLLKSEPWDICYLGHSLKDGLPQSPTHLLQFAGPFYLMHCYVVHRSIYAALLDFLAKVIERPAGDPLGGKLYIDAAHTMFRAANPERKFVVGSPVLSVQRGSPSSLNTAPWYDKNSMTAPVVGQLRRTRDELWRQGLLKIGAKGELGSAAQHLGQFPATPWPSTSAKR